MHLNEITLLSSLIGYIFLDTEDIVYLYITAADPANCCALTLIVVHSSAFVSATIRKMPDSSASSQSPLRSSN